MGQHRPGSNSVATSTGTRYLRRSFSSRVADIEFRWGETGDGAGRPVVLARSSRGGRRGELD